MKKIFVLAVIALASGLVSLSPALAHSPGQTDQKMGYGMSDSGLIGKYCHLGIFYKEYGRSDFHAGFSFWAKDKDNAIELKFYDNNLFYRKFGKYQKTKIYQLLAPIYRAIVLYINKQKVLPYSWFENMKTITVYGLDFKILSDYEQYLLMTYGKNWREPEKGWSVKKWKYYDKLLMRYTIQDKKLRDLWIKREDINSDL